MASLLVFVAGVGNFGIPALLGLPANFITLPTLIYRQLVSFGPTGIAEAAALSMSVAVIAGIGVLAITAHGRTEARRETEVAMTPFWTLGAMRPVVEAGLWIVIVLCCLLPFASLLATALVPAFGVKLTLYHHDLRQIRGSAVAPERHHAGVPQFIPVRGQCRADPVGSRHRARLCARPQSRKIPPRARSDPGNSLCLARHRARGRLHPVVPAAAAADRRQHLRDAVHHRVRLSGALSAAGAETAACGDGRARARSGRSSRARWRQCLAAPAPYHRAEFAAGRGGGRVCSCFFSPSTN